MTRQWFSRRLIVFIAVLACHCVFLFLLWIREPIARQIAHIEPTSVLFFIETPPRARVTPAPSVPTPSASATPTVIATEPKVTEQTSTAPNEPPTPPATIDWNAQATEAAAAIVDKAIQDDKRKCDPSDSPKSFLPPCHHETKKFDWAEPRTGFSGGLPYVRVGERCAIGLGFFGCGFGKRPPANGDLFEAMDDPERDRSSVPDP